MAVDHSWQAVFKPGASNAFFRAGHPAHFDTAAEVLLPHRTFLQAPSFLAGHAPLNYTAQLPVAFEN